LIKRDSPHKTVSNRNCHFEMFILSVAEGPSDLSFEILNYDYFLNNFRSREMRIDYMHSVFGYQYLILIIQ